MTSLRCTLLAAVVAGGLLYPSVSFCQDTPQTPGSTGPSARFVTIDRADWFTGFFNIARGTVRFVCVLSPTDPDCREAFDTIRRIMETTPSKRLRAYMVYQPSAEGDSREVAFQLAAGLNEPRVAHFWDPTFSMSRLLAPVADSDDPAEPRCYVFDPNAVLSDGAPGNPVLMMDPRADEGPHPFDPDGLAATVESMLADLQAAQRRRISGSDR